MGTKRPSVFLNDLNDMTLMTLSERKHLPVGGCRGCCV